MTLKDKLKKLTAIGAFALAGVTSTLGGEITPDKPIETDQKHQTVQKEKRKKTHETSIFILNGSKYLVPNENDTLQSYRERLKNDAPKLDKDTQEWQRKNKLFVNTTPVKSVIELCQANLESYLYIAIRQISSHQHCSEDEAIQKLSDPKNPWRTLGRLALKEKNNIKNISLKKQQER